MSGLGVWPGSTGVAVNGCKRLSAEAMQLPESMRNSPASWPALSKLCGSEIVTGEPAANGGPGAWPEESGAKHALVPNAPSRP